MPKKEIDYSKGLIYVIVCKDSSITDLYVGSTTNFIKRKRHHIQACKYKNDKHYKYKVYESIRSNGGWDNWAMIKIEKYPWADKNELTARERYFYELLRANLNSRYPQRTKKENIEATKESKIEYDKLYREQNREKRNIQKREYYDKNKAEINERRKQQRLKNRTL